MTGTVSVRPAVRDRAFTGYPIRRTGTRVQVRTAPRHQAIPHILRLQRGRAWWMEADEGVHLRDRIIGVCEVDPGSKVLLTDGRHELVMRAGVWLLYHHP